MKQRRRVTRVFKAVKRRARRTADILTKFVNLISSDLRDVTCLVLVGAVTAFALAVSSNFAGSTLGVWLAANPNVVSTWILNHSTSFLGGLMFLPVLWRCPTKLKILLAGAVVGWVVFVPQPSLWEYSVQAVGVHLLIRSKDIYIKILVGSGMALAYALGYVVLPHHGTQNRSHVPAHHP
jgi:hypothetical protein